MRYDRQNRFLRATFCGFLIILTLACDRLATRQEDKAPQIHVDEHRGRWMIYVPAYSHVATPGYGTTSLATTLTIHNVASFGKLTIRSVEYHEPRSDEVKHLLRNPAELLPLHTLDFVLDEVDHEGGTSAAFVITYDNDKHGTRAPLVEAVMIGATARGAFAFTSRGIEVVETR